MTIETIWIKIHNNATFSVLYSQRHLYGMLDKATICGFNTPRLNEIRESALIRHLNAIDTNLPEREFELAFCNVLFMFFG